MFKEADEISASYSVWSDSAAARTTKVQQQLYMQTLELLTVICIWQSISKTFSCGGDRPPVFGFHL